MAIVKVVAQAVTAYAVPAVASWSVPTVRDAIADHEDGRLSDSAVLADALGRDPRIAGCLETRVAALLSKGGGVDFAILPSDKGDQRRAKSVAAEVDSWWWEAAPEWVLRRVLADIVMLGVTFGRREYRAVDGKWLPTLVPWHASAFWWDHVEGRWNVQTQQGPKALAEDPNWVVIEPGGDRSWMGGAIRSLGAHGIATSDAFRDWARFCERHGLPILGIEEPANASPEAREAFFSKLRTLGSSGVVRLPKGDDGTGFDVKMIEPKDGAWEAFRGFLETLRSDIAIRIKGNNLTTEVKGGSYAATAAHREVDGIILASDAQTLSTALREALVKPWGRVNFDWWSDDLAPWPTWDTSPPEDLAQKASTLKTAGEAYALWATSLAVAGKQVDAEAYAELFGLPIKDLDAPPPAAPAPALPPGEAPPDEGDEAEPVDDPEQPEEDLLQSPVRLAQGPDEAPPGASAGQAYVDGLVTGNTKAGAKAIAPDLATVLEALEAATDFNDLRRRLRAAYRDMAPAELAGLLERAIVLAELAGRHAVLADL